MDRYTNEELAKTQQNRSYEQCQTGMGMAGGCVSNEKQVSTRESLMNRLRNSNNEQEKLNRALAILEAHPEFEDFFWLLRSNVL